MRIVLNGGLGTSMGLVGPEIPAQGQAGPLVSGDHPAPGRAEPLRGSP
ncbi:MAG: UTP--glucose-1-phosphate uridylyltransferase [Desulfobacterales bacterium]|nr:UTP--glucose-1-phosphate uridylyltransferase [Desulfobacterales bacterium]